MKKKMKKWLSVALAVVLMASALPLIAGAIAPSSGGSVQGTTSSGPAPLKVEIKSDKDKYILLGKMAFTATITNTSTSTVENISAQALLGSSLRPLAKGSQFTATKASLAPNESFSFTYYADLSGLKGLDNLLLPLYWISSLFHGGKASIGNGNGGADYIEASKAVGLVSLSAKQYEASTKVRVWYAETTEPPIDPPIDDKWPVSDIDIGDIEGHEDILMEDDSWLRKYYPEAYLEYSPERTATLNLNRSYSLVTQQSLSSIDNTLLYPAPGNQGSQKSCTAWATTYAYKSHQDNLDHNWGLIGDNHLFSPAYVYNQLNGGVHRGIGIAEAMELLVNQGACTLADMPFDQDDFLTQPNSAQRAAALPHRAWDRAAFRSGNTTLIKTAIRITGGAVVCVPVHPDFDNISDSNKIYDTLDGQRRGHHAICLIGYDDELQAYKFINSWGNHWGLNGYGYVAYDLLEDLNTYVYFMVDEKETENVNQFGDITGTVRDKETNEPLPGVTVTAYNSSNQIAGQTTTSASGHFGFHLLEGQYTFTYSLDGYFTAENGFPISRGTITIMQNPVLLTRKNTVTQGTITGKVIEQGTSTPLSGVLVEACKVGSTAVVNSTTTNASGQYSLALDINETYNLKFSKSGYEEQTKANVNLVDVTMALSDVVMAKSTSPFTTTPMIAAGERHTIALKSDGTVWAWGANEYGQLGDGTTIDRYTPIQVQGLDAITAISGGNLFSAALRNDGTVWTWGVNLAALLGDSTVDFIIRPVQVQNLSNVTDIAVGTNFIVALKSDGTVWSWGSNSLGKLGDGTTSDRITPVQVKNLSNIVAISAGYSHAIALCDDGTVWAWGWNNEGQLGDGTTTWDRTTPVQAQNLNNITAVAAGGKFTAALRNDGTVWTWGSSLYGQLGRATSPITPGQAQNLSNVTAIATGGCYTVALSDDGTVWGWGLNYNGQLGDGTTTNRSVPVQVQSLDDVVAIAAGIDFYSMQEDGSTVALKNDGTVWAWGANKQGQLGDGTIANRRLPVQVLGENGVGYFNVY